MDPKIMDIGSEYKFGFKDPEKYIFKSRKGLSKEVVEEISFIKSEPNWMREFRLKSSFGLFKKTDANMGQYPTFIHDGF